jgi:photosynthetic reaction center H subunit
MGTGHITSYIDVAQVTLYLFWLFFAGLIYYIRTEDKREGYPLIADGPLDPTEGFPFVPAPITRLVDHPEFLNPDRVEPPLNAQPTGPWPGAPLEPVGDPMLAGVGPGAWANRTDLPDLAYDDHLPKIVPLRVAGEFSVAGESADPRGMDVVGADGKVAGKVVELWLDRAEYIFRYLEVSVNTPAGGRNVLVPMTMAVVKRKAGQVEVTSILASQFADVPGLKNPDQITLLEEDKICAYYGGGTLYATPSRVDPIL